MVEPVKKKRSENSTSVWSVCLKYFNVLKPKSMCVSGKLVFETPKWQHTFALRTLLKWNWALVWCFKNEERTFDLEMVFSLFKPIYELRTLWPNLCLFLVIFCQDIFDKLGIGILWVDLLQTLTRPNSSTRATWGFNGLLHVLSAIVIPTKVA